MNIVTLLETKPKKWKPVSSLIMLLEGTDHSHSCSTWKDPRTKIRAVAEARGSGCRIVTNHHFKADNLIVRGFQYEMTDEQLLKYEQYIWEQLGKPYGKKHLIGLGLMRICALDSNPFKDGEYSQICVELSARGIAFALDIELPKGIEDWGLIQMHKFNHHCWQEGLCKMLPKEKINRINGVDA